MVSFLLYINLTLCKLRYIIIVCKLINGFLFCHYSQQGGNNMKKNIIKILILLFSIIFICSAAYIVNYKYKSIIEKERFQELQNKVIKNPETVEIVETSETIAKQTEAEVITEASNPTEEQEEVLTILPEYEALYEENQDLIGWIKIDNTVIDYPVMQTLDEPIYYNHRDWNKNESVYGLPLIDARCTLESENIIIYSHHMKDGTMFGSLKWYTDINYYNNHPIIEFDTIYEKAQYQVMAVLLSQVYYEKRPDEGEFVYYDYTNMNEEQFQEYVNQVKNLSLYDTEITAEYGDKLITLCTCYYHVKDGRLLVVAKKIQ